MRTDSPPQPVRSGCAVRVERHSSEPSRKPAARKFHRKHKPFVPFARRTSGREKPVCLPVPESDIRQHIQNRVCLLVSGSGAESGSHRRRYRPKVHRIGRYHSRTDSLLGIYRIRRSCPIGIFMERSDAGRCPRPRRIYTTREIKTVCCNSLHTRTTDIQPLPEHNRRWRADAAGYNSA